MNRYALITTLASILGKAAYDDYKNLSKKQTEMKKSDLVGGDNYYHRLAMCENAQKGLHHVITSLGGGIAKKGKDIFCKSTGWCDNETTLLDALKDSYKDMGNNIEGLYWGLTNPNGNCKIWLEDLDIGSKTWKNKK